MCVRLVDHGLILPLSKGLFLLHRWNESLYMLSLQLNIGETLEKVQSERRLSGGAVETDYRDKDADISGIFKDQMCFVKTTIGEFFQADLMTTHHQKSPLFYRCYSIHCFTPVSTQVHSGLLRGMLLKGWQQLKILPVSVTFRQLFLKLPSCTFEQGEVQRCDRSISFKKCTIKELWIEKKTCHEPKSLQNLLRRTVIFSCN